MGNTSNRRKVSSVANLRSLTAMVVGNVISVDSYYGDNKGGGGLFTCVSITSGGYIDDGGAVIIGSDNRVYERNVTIVLDVKAFGVNESDSDSQVKINKAIEYVSKTTGIVKLIVRGVIKINGTINVDFGLDTYKEQGYDDAKSCEIDLCWDPASVLLYTGIGNAVFVGNIATGTIKVKTKKNGLWWVDLDSSSEGILHSPENPTTGSDFWFEAQGFFRGIHIAPDSILASDRGFITTSHYHLGNTYDNGTNLLVRPVNGGFWNQNRMSGGSLNTRSDIVSTETVTGMILEGSINGNSFHDINMEGSKTDMVMEVISAFSNTFNNLRFESVPDNSITFDINSRFNRFANCIAINNDHGGNERLDLAVVDNSSIGNFIDSRLSISSKPGYSGDDKPAFYAKRDIADSLKNAFEAEANNEAGEIVWAQSGSGKQSFWEKNSSRKFYNPCLVYDPSDGTLKTQTGNVDNPPSTLFDYKNSRVSKDLKGYLGQVYNELHPISLASISGGVLTKTRNGQYYTSATDTPVTISSFTGFSDGEVCVIASRPYSAGADGIVTFEDNFWLDTINSKDFIMKQGDYAAFLIIADQAQMINVPRSMQMISESGLVKTGSTLDLNINGNSYNWDSEDTKTYDTYTLGNIVINGSARCLVNKSGSAPVVTGAVLRDGAAWVENTDIEMLVESPNGVTIYYSFISI